MPSAKEIKSRIASIKDTQKITNAMYLISSTKLRKAKNELNRTRPYFDALKGEIKRIFRTVPDVDSRYFYPPAGAPKLEGEYACLVITADKGKIPRKGMAGAYNHNVLKIAREMLHEHPETELFVVGEYGRQHFAQAGIPIEKSFLYPAQNPTLHRAREICDILLERYDNGEFQKLFIVYTDMKNSLSAEATSTRLLPFHRGDFASVAAPGSVHFEFTPGVEVHQHFKLVDVFSVLDNIIRSYITGFVYSALVDSFCAEQNARMTAMSSAGENADKMLASLSVQYNRVRQASITQEITEVSSGAKAQKRKKVQSC